MFDSSGRTDSHHPKPVFIASGVIISLARQQNIAVVSDDEAAAVVACRAGRPACGCVNAPLCIESACGRKSCDAVVLAISSESDNLAVGLESDGVGWVHVGVGRGATGPERRVEDAEGCVACDTVAADEDEAACGVDCKRSGMDAGTEVGLGAAACTKRGVERHIGVEPQNPKAIVHGTDCNNLAVRENLHVVDDVDASGDRKNLLAGAVERRIEYGGQRLVGGAGCKRRDRVDRDRDCIGVALGTACADVAKIVGGDRECGV